MLFSHKVKRILKHADNVKAIIQIDRLLTPLYRQQPEQLSAEEKNIVYIEELEREVNHGGFENFFSKKAGDYTRETLIALQSIQSVTFLQLLNQAMQKFPRGYVPSDQTKRQKILGLVLQQQADVFEDLNWEFYHYDEDLYGLMRTYILANIRNFR